MLKPRYFAELKDVDEAQVGILRALIDLIYQKKIKSIENIRIGNLNNGKLFVDNLNYYVGIDYPNLWDCITNTNIKAAVETYGKAEPITDGLELIPYMLKKYLKNKYNMVLLGTFVGLDIIDEINQAQNFNVEPLISVNSDNLPKEWWDSFEKYGSDSIKKAAYKATLETLVDADWAKLLIVEEALEDALKLVGQIEAKTLYCQFEVKDSYYKNEKTGATVEYLSDIINKVCSILAKREFDPDNQYVSQELWNAPAFQAVREESYGVSKDEVERLQPYVDNPNIPKEDRRAAKKAITQHLNEAKKDAERYLKKRYGMQLERELQKEWKYIGRGDEHEPFNFNVLLENSAYELDDPQNLPDDYYDVWYPILSLYYGQIYLDESSWGYNYDQDVLDAYLTDLDQHTELFL